MDFLTIVWTFVMSSNCLGALLSYLKGNKDYLINALGMSWILTILTGLALLI